MKFMQVNEKVKKNWIINRIIFLCILLVGYLCSFIYIPRDIFGLWLGLIILESILVLMQVIYTFIFPFVQYKKYLYLVKEDEIVFYRGVIFVSSCVIPIVQIQDVGFSQGPIQLMLGLASLEISTAGSNHEIDGLKKEEAEQLVDKIKEQIKVLVPNKNKGE